MGYQCSFKELLMKYARVCDCVRACVCVCVCVRACVRVRVCVHAQYVWMHATIYLNIEYET